MLDLSTTAKQGQAQVLAPGQIRALKLLAKSLPELRTEVMAEVAANPALEDVDHPLETSMSELEAARKRDAAAAEDDYPEDDFTPGAHRADEEQLERRQAFFDRQTEAETLQQHLTSQLPLSGLPREDWNVAEVLIGDLDASGLYRGSLPDMMMAFGLPQERLEAILAEIRSFDPPGCGARTAKECLLAQLDAIADPTLRARVRTLIEDHLEELAAGTLDRAAWGDAMKALLTLEPHPGRAFPSERDRVEYINPEVHVERDSDGSFFAYTDKRSLPEIRISKKFLAMLRDPNLAPETRDYVRAKIESAKAFREAIARRQETVEGIAEAICERQQDFFTQGFKALKPLTEAEIAAAVGVSPATVSRTVTDKYASTPQGTVELRRFFTSGVRTVSGAVVAQDAVLAALKALVDGEDAAAPLSDEKLSKLLAERGYSVARRTVAKYRDKLAIPGIGRKGRREWTIR